MVDLRTRRPAHTFLDRNAVFVPGAPVKDWAQAAGMDFEIGRSQLRYGRDINGENERIAPNLVGLYRKDSRNFLGAVSKKYKAVQPLAIMEFFSRVCERTGFVMDMAHALYDGRQFYALATVGEDAEVGNGDAVRGNLLMTTSADSSLATDFRYTTSRLVCTNQMRMVRSEGDPAYRVTHRSFVNFETAERKLGLIGEGATKAFGHTMDVFRKLADTTLSDVRAATLTGRLVTGPKWDSLTAEEKIEAIEGKKATKIRELFSGTAQGANLDGVHGTAWGWLNAVTEFSDHHTVTKGEFASDNRLSNALWGRDDFKRDALNLITG